MLETDLSGQGSGRACALVARIEDLERRVFELKAPEIVQRNDIQLAEAIRTLHDGARASA